MRTPRASRIARLALVAALASCLAALAMLARAARAAEPPPAVTFTATDYAYSGPEQIEGGLVSFALVQRLNEGVSMDDFIAALKQRGLGALALTEAFGGHTLLFPGEQRPPVILDLLPGQYVLLSTTSDQNGTPDVAKGMLKPLTVTARGTPGAVAEPRAVLTVNLRDAQPFDLPASLGPGQQTWLVRSAGTEVHQIIVFKLAPGATADEMLSWLRSPRTAPAPVEAVAAGIQGLSPGRRGWIAPNLTPGNYLAVCDLPAAERGKRHYDNGEFAAFTVGTMPGLPGTGGGHAARPPAAWAWLGIAVAGVALAAWGLLRHLMRRRRAR